MAPVKLVDFDPDSVDPQNPAYGMELSKGYFGVYQPARRDEPRYSQRDSEVTGLGSTPRGEWSLLDNLPISTRVGRSIEDIPMELSRPRYGYLHNANGLLNIYEDHRIGKRAADARKPDPDADLSAASLEERDFDAASAEAWFDDRQYTQLGGPFTVYDLSKRGKKNPWVGHGGRLDRDTEPKKEMTAEEVKAQLDDLGDPFFHYVDDRDARSKKDGPYPGEPMPGQPNSTSTRDVNDLVARWIKQYDPAFLDHRLFGLEQRTDAIHAGPRFFSDVPEMKGISKVIYGTAIVTMVFAVIGVVAAIYSCFKRHRRGINKKLGLNRSSHHRALAEADKVAVPETSQTAPAHDLEQSLPDVEPGSGPAIADQLPTNGNIDRLTGKRVSFNVPGKDIMVEDFESPNKRGFEEPRAESEEVASPASPR